MSNAGETIETWCKNAEVDVDLGSREGEYVITLPGERKLKTVVSLMVGSRSLTALAFVIRNPDEAHESVYRLLLQRNLRHPGVSYGIDGSGDIYAMSQLPLTGLDDAAIDQLMGRMLEASDGIFNDILALGFITSMRKEWQWRTDRGESTRNLEAFKHLLS